MAARTTARAATSKPKPAPATGVAGAPGTAPAPAAPGAAARWTILVWIAGDNNLSDYGNLDLAELKQVGSSAAVNLVAQYDRAGSTGTRRYVLRKGTTLDADAVADLGETNTGDPAVAIDFFTWGIRTYPSDHVMCVLWNHGSGIDEADIYARARAVDPPGSRGAGGPPRPDRGHVRAIASSRLSRALFSTTVTQAIGSRAIAYDDTSRDFLDNLELARVLSTVVTNTGKPVDIVGFDACLMNMIEVGYQLRANVGYVVGSEEVEPGDGWPYEQVAAAAAKASASSAARLATAIVSSYVASYAQAHEDRVTQSAVDLSKAGTVADAVGALAAACMASLQTATGYKAFTQAVTQALRFEVKDFVDLGDLCAHLAARSTDTDVVDAAKAVSAALAGGGPRNPGYVIAAGHKGDGVAAATGTAIYFPLAGDAHVAYDRLDFAAATRWGELIAAYRNA